MATKNETTWLKYFDQFCQKEVNKDELNIDGIDKIINMQRHGFDILNHSVPMIYLLDYTTGKYKFVSKQCRVHLNFNESKMLDGGISFVQERYHPDDLKLFNQQIFTDRLKVLRQIPAAEQKDYIFSLSYRVKTDKSDYTHILQRNSFVKSDAKGNPLISMGVVTNINHFKTENPVIQLVEKIDPVTCTVEAVQKNTYYLREEDKIFSKREKEILPWLAEGLTSKQIADKLFISEHTVINHKRNMHHKSDTQNSAALISFAFRQHLL